MVYEDERFEHLEYQGNTIENRQFYDCTFKDCDFSEMQIISCSFRDCTFQNCTILNNSLKFTDACNNQFTNCMIIGISWSDLVKGKTLFLPFYTFEQCTLKYNVFYQLKLKSFNFNACDLSGSFFEKCTLSKSNFSYCNLKDTQFIENDLTGADFRHALNYLISIETNKLKAAKFSFPEAVNLLTAMGIKVEYE